METIPDSIKEFPELFVNDLGDNPFCLLLTISRGEESKDIIWLQSVLRNFPAFDEQMIYNSLWQRLKGQGYHVRLHASMALSINQKEKSISMQGSYVLDKNGFALCVRAPYQRVL